MGPIKKTVDMKKAKRGNYAKFEENFMSYSRDSMTFSVCLQGYLLFFLLKANFGEKTKLILPLTPF
jgi:hypothetical protein